MSKANSMKTICTLSGRVRALDARTGKEIVLTARVTVKGQNPRARAEKAVIAQIKAQRYWMLLEPITVG